MRSHNILLVLILLLSSCKGDKTTQPLNDSKSKAQELIDRTIQISGGEHYGNSIIGFNFRGLYYNAKRQNGDFSLSRIQVKDGDSIIDILSNEGFSRFINNEFQTLHDSMAVKYTASVNSVHYFSILPYGLNDRAVLKTYLDQELISGETYDKIQIRFKPQGGGEDYDDVFIYWVNTTSYKVDYLAYSYEEDDGRGMRFREALNERYINGLRFVDYINYKPKSENITLQELGQQFNNDELITVSKINLENVEVKLIDLE